MALLALAFALCMGMAAQAASLVPLGQAVGIQMTTAGVLVADLAEVDTPGGTCTPAKDAGLRPGDVICRMDGREIVSSADFLAALDAAGDTVSVTVRRLEKPRSVANARITFMATSELLRTIPKMSSVFMIQTMDSSSASADAMCISSAKKAR